MSNTPRTEAAYFKPHATMYDLAGEMKLMERELNAANDRIKRLEDSVSYWNERYNNLNHKVQNRDNY
jgi:predicted nuclease with TOPRIM domain